MVKQGKLYIVFLIIFPIVILWGCNTDILVPVPGLLMNPGAEDGMHHWEYTEAVVRSVNEIDQQTGRVFPRSGNFFFDMTGANVDDDSVAYLRQTIDIENYNSAPFTAGGWIQTELWPDDNRDDIIDNDYGELIVIFNDSEGNILDSLSTGPIGYPVKGYPTTNGRQYAEFVLTGTIPIKTIKVIYELRGYLIQGVYINVFYDDLYFRVD